MVKNHSDCERLPLPISSKGSFICTIPQTGLYIPWPLLHQSQSTDWNEKSQEAHLDFLMNIQQFLSASHKYATVDQILIYILTLSSITAVTKDSFSRWGAHLDILMNIQQFLFASHKYATVDQILICILTLSSITAVTKDSFSRGEPILTSL